jgi:hypothetical protein
LLTKHNDEKMKNSADNMKIRRFNMKYLLFLLGAPHLANVAQILSKYRDISR